MPRHLRYIIAVALGTGLLVAVACGYRASSEKPSTETRSISPNAKSNTKQPNDAGIRAHRMRIILSPDRMRARNLSPEEIIKALTPSGFAGSPMLLVTKTWQSKEYELIHIGLYGKAEQYNNIILSVNRDGKIVRLGDVSEIEMVSVVYISRDGALVDKLN